MNDLAVRSRKMRAERYVCLKQRANGAPPMVDVGLAQAPLDVIYQMIRKNRDKKMALYAVCLSVMDGTKSRLAFETAEGIFY
jgi:hypothetical protein